MFKRNLILIILTITVATIGYVAYVFANRPLFADHFGWHEHGVFPQWHNTSTLFDNHGNFAKVDRKRGIVLIVSTSSEEALDLVDMSTQGHDVLIRHNKQTEPQSFQAKKNTIYVVDCVNKDITEYLFKDNVLAKLEDASTKSHSFLSILEARKRDGSALLQSS